MTEEKRMRGRERAAAYSRALRRLRDLHPDKFDELFAEEIGRPRMKTRHGHITDSLTEPPLFGSRRELVFAGLLKHQHGIDPSTLSRYCLIPHASTEKALKELVDGGWAEVVEPVRKKARWSVKPSAKALQWAQNELETT